MPYSEQKIMPQAPLTFGNLGAMFPVKKKRLRTVFQKQLYFMLKHAEKNGL